MTSDSASDHGPAGTVVHFTASSGCDTGDTAEYQFYEQLPSGTWILARDFATSPSFTFDTTGQPTGTYQFQAWVRATGSANPVEAVGYGTFTVTSAGATCSSATLSGSPTSPQATNTPVTLNATASGCSTPEYAFFELVPGGSWQQVQGYSASSSYSGFDTSTTGNYSFQVWVRQAGSTAALEASANLGYSLTAGTACSSASLTPSVSSPQPVGSGVTFTASASGCSDPRFEFYELPPGGSWTRVQAYSASSSLTFDTSGAAGSYSFQVWARDASSTAAFEATADRGYTLTSGSSSTPCANATLTAPVTVGIHQTTITMSATSSSCSAARYAFFELAPGSNAWQLVQDFSSTASFTFTDPANGPLGDYQFQVWVKDAASSAAFDTFKGLTYSSGFVSADASHVTLADGTVADRSFTGTVCADGLRFDSNGAIAICTEANGVWYGGLKNASTNNPVHDPLWVQNNGQIPLDPANPANTGQFVTNHGNGLAIYSGGGGKVAFFTSDTNAANWGQATSNTFSSIGAGPFAYPGTAVVWRQDTNPAGAQLFPQTITAALLGASSNNYQGSFDTNGNTVMLHGNGTIGTDVATAVNGARGRITSIVDGDPSTSQGSHRNTHFAVFANGDLSKGGGVYWSCGTSGNLFQEDDTGMTAADKSIVGVIAMDSASGGAASRTCGSAGATTDNVQVMYAGLRGGSSFYATRDGGATWGVANAGLPAGVSVFAIAIDSTSTVVYIATSAGIYRSTDRAVSWQLIGLSGKTVRAIVVQAHAANALPRIIAATNEANGLYQTFAPPGDAIYTGATALPCSAATVTIVPASPQAAGAGNIAINVSSVSQCKSANYAYFFLPPGGSWTQTQAYSPRSATTFANSSTSPAAPGNYSIQIWVRDASQTGAFDLVKEVTYTITAP